MIVLSLSLCSLRHLTSWRRHSRSREARAFLCHGAYAYVNVYEMIHAHLCIRRCTWPAPTCSLVFFFFISCVASSSPTVWRRTAFLPWFLRTSSGDSANDRACTYVLIYVYMYVCMYVRVCIYVCACVYVCMHSLINTWIWFSHADMSHFVALLFCTCSCEYSHASLTHACKHSCTCAQTYILHVYMRMAACIRTCKCAHVFKYLLYHAKTVHTCMYVCNWMDILEKALTWYRCIFTHTTPKHKYAHNKYTKCV